MTNLSLANNVIISQIRSNSDHLFNVYILPALAINGIVGNLLGCIVMHRLIKCTKVPSYTYLFNLTFADLCVSVLLLINAVRTIGKYTNNDWDKSYALVWVTVRITFAGINYFMKVSVWIVVLLTADRYIMICHILKYRAWCTVRNIRIGLIIIYLTCLCWMIPLSLKYDVVEIDCASSASAKRRIEKLIINAAFTLTTNYDMSKNYSFILKDNISNNINNHIELFKKSMICYGFGIKILSHQYRTYEITKEIIMTFIPLILLLVLKVKILIIYRVIVNLRPKIHDTKTMRDEKSLTLTMFGVLIFLLICMTPGSIILIMDTYYGSRWRIANNNFNIISNTLESSNYIFNFYIYCVSNKVIRRHLCQLFHRPEKTQNVRFRQINYISTIQLK
ncbi:unnamed protein product [Gordionus sp. m RMFG-2023]|uniref:probable G-protein coupled receptor B0563.6 n=1 Tax=Gordionus sp. m RMFG-2023 TaxID=3053472 RepID=UPI0030E41C28